MNIKIGEYIRTKNGIIGKYEGMTDYDKEGQKLYGLKVIKRFIPLLVREENITSHSKDIIDLIEVNDIVTYWVDTQSYNGWVQNFVDKELLKDMKKNFINEDIKSIVTHEQIENMEYKV